MDHKPHYASFTQAIAFFGLGLVAAMLTVYVNTTAPGLEKQATYGAIGTVLLITAGVWEVTIPIMDDLFDELEDWWGRRQGGES